MNYPVVDNRRIADGIYSLWFDAPVLAAMVKPGQFVHILCGGGTYLRRPISVCDVDGSLVRVVYATIGEGTRWLSQVRVGETLDILGAFGNGFPLDIDSDVALLGGGIGVAPLLYLARHYGNRATVTVGFASKSKAILLAELADICANVQVFTDDGSLGKKGNIGNIEQLRNVSVFACGPRPMLAALPRIATDAVSNVYVSLEERMACAQGTCLGCVVMTHNGYKRVCKDGPVFEMGTLTTT